MSAWVRRHGMALIAAGAIAGILIPDLAAATRPLLLPVSLATMGLALLRVEPAALFGVLRRPRLALLLLAWVTFGVPLLVAAALGPLLAGSVFLVAAVLIAATPSVLSAAVFAILLGADAALLTVVAIPSNALAPVWLPSIAALMGVSAQIDPFTMARRLAVIVGGAFAIAATALRLFGREAIRTAAPPLDTAIVLAVAASAIPAMDGVGELLAASPLRFAAMLGFALALNLVLQAIGFLVFLAAPRRAALSAGLVSGTRNLVLLLAALPDPRGTEIGLIVAAAQLSLFVMPVLVAPIYRRLGG